MDNVVHTALEDLIRRKISLSQAKISQASKSHNYIRSLLGNRHLNDDNFPKLIDGDFLSGSYARGTKIHPLDDIDVMLIIDGQGLYAMNNGVSVSGQVRGSTLGINPIMNHLGQDGLLSSRKVLDIFMRALKESHPTSTVSKDGQAINVWLESHDMGVDIVPCFHILSTNANDDLYYIPNGANNDSWMMTNPKIDENISNTLKSKHENFISLVRLVKYWNQKCNAERLRSYHLETLAWHIFFEYDKPMYSLENGVYIFFSNVEKFLSAPCADATGIGKFVDEYLTSENRQASLDNSEKIFNALHELYQSGITDDKYRLQVFEQIFKEKL